jgi:hydrocephalus-inducing protein
LQVARRVKIIPPDTPFFGVRFKQQASKVAAGMEAICAVTFSPATNEDYEHDLVVCTEREKFIVPIRAQGARAMLDLPASITFGDSCPCRSTTSRTLLVRNIGRCSDSFSLIASPPYSVAPQRAFLNVGETLQLQLNLTPIRVGDVKGSLKVQFERGPRSTAELHGRSVEIDVAVMPTDVHFISTFVTKTTLQYFHILNRTEQTVSFSLKRFASATEAGQAQDLLADGAAASTDQSKSGSQLDVFGTRAMSAFPMEGIVYPGTQFEVCKLQ